MTLKDSLKSFHELNREHALIRRRDRVVAAVSGGADSVCMLLMLKALERSMDLTIVVAHLDHGLQKNSARAARKVQALSAELDLECVVGRVKIAGRSRSLRRGLEETGRMERYAFLRRVASRFNARLIATAHTRDDVAETVMMRLLRGASLRGLAGIPASRSELGYRIIRPILNISKSDCAAILKRERRGFYADPSNDSEDFTRNRVRHTLLPLIEARFNPSFKESLEQLGRIARDAHAYLEGSAAQALRKLRPRKSRQGLRVRSAGLNRLHPAVAREVYYLLYRQWRGDARRLSFKHIESIRQACLRPGADARISIPGGTARIKNGSLILSTLSD